MGSGDWRTSAVFEEVGAAVDHLMPLSHWKLLPEEDRAYQIAYGRAKSTMEAWSHHQSSEAAKKKR